VYFTDLYLEIKIEDKMSDSQKGTFAVKVLYLLEANALRLSVLQASRLIGPFIIL